MNHTTEAIATPDTSLAARRRRRKLLACRMGRIEAQRSMGPVAVIVTHEDVEDPREMRLV